MIPPQWDKYAEYEKNDVVQYGTKYYFCTKKNSNFRPDLYNPNTNTEILWTTEDVFTWRATYESPIETLVAARRFDSTFGLSIIEDNKLNKNVTSLSLTFDKRDIREAAAILFFLENKKGAYTFDFSPQNPYNQTYKFICKTWRHSFVFHQNNTITATFERKF